MAPGTDGQRLAELDPLPVGATVGAAPGVATQTKGQQRIAVEIERAKEGAAIRGDDLGEAGAVVAGAEQGTLLAGDQHLAAVDLHLVQVLTAWIGNPPDQRLPALAAIGGMQGQAVGADHVAMQLIDEAHAEEGLVRAVGYQVFGTAQRSGGTLLAGFGADAGIVANHHGRLVAVELALPGFAAIGAGQHHTAMPHRPAMGRRGEMHVGQRHAHRHAFGLAPGAPGVVGQQHGTALTYRHQSLTGASDGELQAVLRPRAFPRGEVEQVRHGRPACCVGRACKAGE
ncbi:hypothetical protein D3C81_921220 [compost metagenome]